MSRVVSLKIFGATIIGLLLDAASENRRGLLGAANALQGGVVVWNQYALWRIENYKPAEAKYWPVTNIDDGFKDGREESFYKVGAPR